MTRQWELFPHFVMRSTGFPFDWIDEVGLPETAAGLDAVLEAEDRLAALEKAIVAEFRDADPPPARRVRKPCWEAVRRRRAVPLEAPALETLSGPLRAACELWNEAVESHGRLDAAARATFERELVERRAALRRIASDRRFQEAVWLSSPQMYERGLRRYLDSWSATRRVSETRRIEQQLVSYLQRVCAKNDTAGFFGPINYGDFSPPQATGLAPGCEHVRHREAFVAYWAVAALAETIGADPDVRTYLRPRPSPVAHVDLSGGSATIAGEVTVSLPATDAELLGRVDGERTVADIARACGLATGDTWDRLQRLVRSRLVVLALEVPVTAMRPLRWLLEWVERLPGSCAGRDRWRSVLGELREWQDAFAPTDLEGKRDILRRLEERLVALTGREPRQGSGDVYADRLMVYEECLGGMTPLALGPDFATRLHDQLRPVLDAYAAHALAVHAELQRHGAELLEGMLEDGSVPFLRAVAELGGQAPFTAAGSPWLDAALAQLRPRADEREVELDLAALPAPDPAEMEAAPLLTSPDLMFVARDADALRNADFQVVVGECHDTLMVWGWALAFHPDRPAVEAAAEGLFGRLAGGDGLANVLPSRRVKILPFEYPGPTIEIGMASERPADRLPASQVTATVRGGRPVLEAPGRPPMTLANGELPTLAHSVFAPPRVVPPRLDLGPHTPRIVAGDVVLQRESWRLTRQELLPGRYQGTSFELMADFRRASRRLGLPRFVFARIPGQPKPVLVDRDGYFLLELLHHLAAPDAELVLSEMLPGPEALWLKNRSSAFCSELRVGAFSVDARA